MKSRLELKRDSFDAALGDAERSCALGSAEGCNQHGRLARRRTDRIDIARGSFEKSCGMKNEEGCRLLAGLDADEKERDRLRHRCDLGDAAGCRPLAVLYAESYGSWPKADDALRIACDKFRDGEACFMRWTYAGRYGNKARLGDRQKYLEQACGLGWAAGCRELGRNFYIDYPDSNPRRQQLKIENMKKFFDRGCRLGDREACGLLAESAATESRRSQLESSCSAGSAADCNRLAQLYMRKFFDYDRAGKVLEGSCCRLDDKEGCRLRQDLASAREEIERLDRACHQGKDSASCLAEGEAQLGKLGQIYNAERSFRRACQLQDEEGCRRMGEVQLKEQRNIEEAGWTLERGCRAGDSKACALMGGTGPGYSL